MWFSASKADAIANEPPIEIGTDVILTAKLVAETYVPSCHNKTSVDGNGRGGVSPVVRRPDLYLIMILHEPPV